MLDRTCLLPRSPLPFPTVYYLHGEGNSRGHAQTTFPPAPSHSLSIRAGWGCTRDVKQQSGRHARFSFLPESSKRAQQAEPGISFLRIPLPSFTKTMGAAESGPGLRWGASCPALRTPTGSRGTPQLLFFLRGGCGIHSFAEKLTDLCKDQFPSMHYQRSWRMHLCVEQTPPGTFLLRWAAQLSPPRTPGLSEKPIPVGNGTGVWELPRREAIPMNWGCSNTALPRPPPPRPYNSAIPYPNNPFSS